MATYYYRVSSESTRDISWRVNEALKPGATRQLSYQAKIIRGPRRPLIEGRNVLEQIGAFTYGKNVDDAIGDSIDWLETYDKKAPEANIGIIPILSLRCNQGELESFIATGWDLPEDVVTVRYRFDNRSASGDQYWLPSSSGVGAFVHPYDVDGFIKQAKSASKVLIRVTDVYSEDHDYTFSIMGIDTALERLPCAQ